MILGEFSGTGNVNCVDDNFVDDILETLQCNVSTTKATTNQRNHKFTTNQRPHSNQKPTNDKNHPQIRDQFEPLFGHTNHWCQNTHANSTQISPGNTVFTTMSFVIHNRLNATTNATTNFKQLSLLHKLRFKCHGTKTVNFTINIMVAIC
jgi:hypothetical protein